MQAILQQLLWVVAAAAAGVVPKVAVPPEPALPPAYHIAGVPLSENHPNWCGPDALAAVLRYFGDTVTVKEIAEDIYRPRYRGSINLDLLVYARRRGYTGEAGAGTALALEQALARDHPVICLIREHGLMASSNHYVILRGYDVKAQVWYVDGGDGREYRASMRAFEEHWKACDRWMLTVRGRKETEGRRAP